MSNENKLHRDVALSPTHARSLNPFLSPLCVSYPSCPCFHVSIASRIPNAGIVLVVLCRYHGTSPLLYHHRMLHWTFALRLTLRYIHTRNFPPVKDPLSPPSSRTCA
ncbi:hypothetical protein BD311DRAFT_748652 [Dichomitus squalens]|uniref:Uncharacterized protein n=1 Tax=Dichomitus squalens TaxID=114155 RepID=A0A4Q9MZ94_9APHY|nr:hypothetical protein BD311DRAFT_748652 [Dichomitus squalens]